MPGQSDRAGFSTARLNVCFTRTVRQSPRFVAHAFMLGASARRQAAGGEKLSAFAIFFCLDVVHVLYLFFITDTCCHERVVHLLFENSTCQLALYTLLLYRFLPNAVSTHNSTPMRVRPFTANVQDLLPPSLKRTPTVAAKQQTRAPSARCSCSCRPQQHEANHTAPSTVRLCAHHPGVC